MRYKLIITKYEENNQYESEMKEFKQNTIYARNGNNNFVNEPQKESELKMLDVFLTEEEFKKIKTEVIKTFE